MNPFEEFVGNSNPIQDGLAAMDARHEKRENNAASYLANIDDLRDQMKAMELAFKDVVFKYAAILPEGWRVTGDFEKWLAGKACAGFVHGALNPSAELMIGGDCETVGDLELALDQLYNFVVKQFA